MEPDGEPEKNGVKGCSAEEELVDMAEWEDKVEKVVGMLGGGGEDVMKVGGRCVRGVGRKG